ncbi:MarR family transcriptional regulator [Escherichia coli]|uniref:MarR family transcriptional regulator n=1 Tax=Escherichia coli TaxID=562 RepID=UPI00069BE954|nr:MarR family transcriptional regulator [Escherichia coli]
MKPTSTSGARILRVLKALKGYSLTGLSNGELAAALHESPANITRAADTLIEEGLVQRLENGRFAMSMAMLQIAHAHATEVTLAQDRLNEMNQRLLAGSR